MSARLAYTTHAFAAAATAAAAVGRLVFGCAFCRFVGSVVLFAVALVVLLLLSVLMFCSMLRDAPVWSLVAVGPSRLLYNIYRYMYLQSAHRIVSLQLAVVGGAPGLRLRVLYLGGVL